MSQPYFHGASHISVQELEAHFDDQTIARIPMTAGLAGHVATTGSSLNIEDVQADPRYVWNDLLFSFQLLPLQCLAGAMTSGLRGSGFASQESMQRACLCACRPKIGICTGSSESKRMRGIAEVTMCCKGNAPALPIGAIQSWVH